MAGLALKIRGLSFMNMPGDVPVVGSPRLNGGGGVLKGVKDQARRAFHQYARACVRSGRRGKFGAFRCGFELTGSVGKTPEVSG